ncbi:MAG: hypothetical protein CL693_04285 [Cellvibrionaceae bacterium]|nr:hypothetical protein [Cellvibrionaceae bacterium]
MATSVRLDDEFVVSAKTRASATYRSLPKQIEYEAKIGQIAIDNPELSYAFIEEALQSKAEMEDGALIPYARRTERNRQS